MDKTQTAARSSSPSSEKSQRTYEQPQSDGQLANRVDLQLGSVLVTGANGFIGSNLVAELTARECEVFAGVRPGRRLAGDMAARCGDIAYRELELDAVDRLAHALEGIDTIVHTAGRTAANSYREFLQTNRTGTYRLLQAAARQPVPPRVILISSVAAAGPRTRERPVQTEDRPEPVSEYGRSKLAGERIARRFAADLPITAIRPGIVFGPGDREVLRLVKLVANTHLNFLPGIRQPLFPFIAVQDLIDCIVKAVHVGSVLRPLDHNVPLVGEAAGDGIYNAADPQFGSFGDFGRWISRGLGHRWHRPVRLPLAAVRAAARLSTWFADPTHPSTFTPDKIREAAVLGWECDVWKTMRELEWAPAASLEERLQQTILWYRQHGWLK